MRMRGPSPPQSVRGERRSRSRGVVIPGRERLRRRAGGSASLTVPWRRARGAGAVRLSSGAERVILAGGVVEDDSNGGAATCGTAWRDERHSVGIVCGRPHNGRGDRPPGRSGAVPRTRAGGAGEPGTGATTWCLVPHMGSERGDFHDHAKVPARQGDGSPRGPSWVHSVFRTLQGVIFVNLWRAKRHFTLPNGR
jgi:hypothetical protein